jgi:hypothetical protein
MENGETSTPSGTLIHELIAVPTSRTLPTAPSHVRPANGRQRDGGSIVSPMHWASRSQAARMAEKLPGLIPEKVAVLDRSEPMVSPGFMGYMT